MSALESILAHAHYSLMRRLESNGVLSRGCCCSCSLLCCQSSASQSCRTTTSNLQSLQSSMQAARTGMQMQLLKKRKNTVYLSRSYGRRGWHVLHSEHQPVPSCWGPVFLRSVFPAPHFCSFIGSPAIVTVRGFFTHSELLGVMFVTCEPLQEYIAILILLTAGVDEHDVPKKLDTLWYVCCHHIYLWCVVMYVLGSYVALLERHIPRRVNVPSRICNA